MATAASPSFHSSSCLEKVLEHRFLADVTTALWLDGVTDFEVLQSHVDAHGYDIVIEARGVLRHIQLKSMVRGGKRRQVSINQRLAAKPSGCVVWMIYDPATLDLGPFYWFGSEPGEGLPDLGGRAARHTKGNAKGLKAERRGHRIVQQSRFARIENVGELVRILFGSVDVAEPDTAICDQLSILLRHLEGSPPSDGPDWLLHIRYGDFSAIPSEFDWHSSLEFAHLISGYALVEEAGWGDPFLFAERRLAAAAREGEWRGGPAELWASLFLEHRRWRMAGRDPDGEAKVLLDRLCTALRNSLQTLGNAKAQPRR